MTSFKHDEGKVQPELLLADCSNAVAGVLDILMFGLAKYGKRASWKDVPEAEARYTSALLRHVLALLSGEVIDPESDKPHIDHIATNALFLSEFHHGAD